MNEEVLSKLAIQLYIDIAYRVPRKKIVFTGTSFYLWDNATSKITIGCDELLELETAGFISKYSTGGYFVTGLGFDSVDRFVQKLTRTNTHGKTESYYDLGEPYAGGTDC